MPVLPAALALLLCNYVGAIVLAWRLPHAFNVPLMVGAHATLALLAVHYTRVGRWVFCTLAYLTSAGAFRCVLRDFRLHIRMAPRTWHSHHLLQLCVGCPVGC